MNILSLEHLTVIPAQPPELVEIAAAIGCSVVYTHVMSLYPSESGFDLRTQPALLAETRRRADSLGVGIRNAGPVLLEPGIQFDAVRQILDAVAELGAQDTLAVGFDPDIGRCTDNFARVCEEALQRGLGVLLEPVSTGAISTPAQGQDLLRRAGNERSGMAVDVLHLHRAGGSVADLAKIEPRYLRYAHLSDGPLKFDPDKRTEESRLQRAVPGEGEFPLADFIRAFPEGTPLGIEVPLADRAAQGMSRLERARLCVEAARRIQASL